MDLLCLPNEILIQIIKFCSYKSVVNLNQTCSTLRHICNLDAVWNNLCIKDYGVSTKGGFSTFSELYHKFLHRYRSLVGMYMLDISGYGGLAEAKYEDDLVFYEWEQNLDDATDSLKKIEIFRILKAPQSISQKKRGEVLCCKNAPEHTAELIKRGRSISVRCCHVNQHPPSNRYYAYPSYITAIEYGLKFLPVRVPRRTDIPESLRTDKGTLPNALIEPGLYHSVSPLERNNIIILRYEDKNTLVGYRVVSFGEDYDLRRCFKVDLRRWTCPTIAEQDSLIRSEETDFPPNKNTHIPLELVEEHHFLICESYQVPEIYMEQLRKCKGRFFGNGKVFGGYYESLHFIVFNKETFGLFWPSLNTFYHFERVCEPFVERIVENVLYVNE